MSPTPARIGVIGLGIMGGTMAGALRRAGHPVSGHDPLPRMRQRARRAGVDTPGSCAAVARVADVLLLSLPSVAALHEVVDELRDAAAPTARQLVIETSTLPPDEKARAARALRGQGRLMLDAPISGTATAHPETTWIMYLSGPVAACRAAARIVGAFTLRAPRVGDFGAGMHLKIAANHLVAIYNVACGEMTALCRGMGLDPAVALEHIGPSPYIGTGLMGLRMPMMIRREYEPATMKVGVWQKDMQVIADMARSAGCPTPLFDACASLYTAAQAQGRGEQDTASVAEVLAGLAGQTRRTD
jgi:3-hydroxyisobutyrate dehydrogenase-like beta-hydroxyacid dehydrogenase